ncbi:MAG: hypothetical protein PHD25_02015 [Bacteroidales bacterium]|nr:hypothetical protein [Bacteroidales bacterium]
MKTRSKLKGPIGRVYPLALMIIYLLLAVEIAIRFGLYKAHPDITHYPYYMVIVAGLFFIVMGVFQYFRYELWDYMVLGFFMGIGSLLTIPGHLYPGPAFKLLWLLNAVMLGFFLIIRWSVLSGHERYESNARRLLKLAVDTIEESSNGFTGRPFPAGRIQASKEELLGFARCLNGKHVTRFFYIDDTLSLAFSLNKSLLVGDQPGDFSHITISPEGKVMVILTMADYQQYKRTFNYDRLCASLGSVFIRFFNYYQKGQEDRIITELKSV